MVHFIHIMSFYLFIPMVINAQWFGLSPSPQGNNLKSVDIINDNIIWAAGDGGVLLKSSDGGSAWQCKPLNNNYQILPYNF